MAMFTVAMVIALAPVLVDAQTIFEGTPPPETANDTLLRTNPNNLSMAEKDDWYIGDHPFFYEMAKVRAPNGSWITNPNASFPPFTLEEWRKNTMARVPWFIRWYVTGETRALRKEMLKKRKYIIDHIVSPMDWGRSIRAKSVRAQWHEQLRHFWTEAIGGYVIKAIKHNIKSVLFGGMQQYIDSKLYVKNFQSMNSTEWGLYNNMTMDEIQKIQAEAAEDVRWKLTRPYRYKMPTDLGEAGRKYLPDIQLMVQYFQPYPNYTTVYYNAEEELPPPTMPAAISYPWPWTDRIAQLRATLVGIMRVEAARNSLANGARNATVASGDGSSVNETTPEAGQGELQRRLEEGGSGAPFVDDEVEAGDDDSTDEGSGSDGSGSSDGIHLDEASRFAAVQQLEQLAKEFHFTSGIPRLDMLKERYSPVAFPSLRQFLNISIDANGSATVVSGEQFKATPSAPEAGDPFAVNSSPANLSAMVQSLPDFTSREGVYAAARYFYSYATVEDGFVLEKDYYKPRTEAPKRPTDGTMLVDDLKSDEEIVVVKCSVESPCLVRSGVTVYTPKVLAAVVDLFTNVTSSPSVADDERRLKRQDWIMNIFQDAFDAEHRVLKSGLLAPSTVWNSYFDRSTDIFADKVVGLVNGSKAMALDSGVQWEARAIFEALMGNTSSPILSGYSRYTMTNYRTRTAMRVTKKVPELVPFTEDRLMYLTGFLVELSRQMETAIDEYERKRDADLMHIAIAKATNEAVYYDGRLFGVLGYGYYLPATNEANVAYRDHKIPVPFHLIVRVLVRLQESHLLLPEESNHIAACVAMLHFDVRYYRCAELKQEEKATPRPMQDDEEDEDTSSPPPPSRTIERVPVDSMKAPSTIPPVSRADSPDRR